MAVWSVSSSFLTAALSVPSCNEVDTVKPVITPCLKPGGCDVFYLKGRHVDLVKKFKREF